MTRTLSLGLLALSVAMTTLATSASAQQQKPNILFIMGDDIGWMQVGSLP
jgi:arylsulfatase